MKKKYKQQQKLFNKRRSIIENITIENHSDIRWMLDNALSYTNRPSEDGLEYKERDIKHILVNHIRHEKSNYDLGLKCINSIGSRLDKKRKNNSSYFLYKNATLDRISDIYPFLEKECNQQKHKMNMVKFKQNTNNIV